MNRFVAILGLTENRSFLDESKNTELIRWSDEAIHVSYLLNFCTKGGICFRFACESLFAVKARR
jgi:hypothetical protein